MTSFFGGLCAGVILSTAVSAAARETSRPKVIYASGPEVMAMFVKRGRIYYPWHARATNRSGRGIFRVYIDPDGKVRTVEYWDLPGTQIWTWPRLPDSTTPSSSPDVAGNSICQSPLRSQDGDGEQ
jgi:hypothetical protein